MARKKLKKAYFLFLAMRRRRRKKSKVCLPKLKIVNFDLRNAVEVEMMPGIREPISLW